MTARKVLHDQFSWHEVLDRAFLFETLIHQHLVEHPVVKANTDLTSLAIQAQENLAALYSLVGQTDPHWVAKASLPPYQHGDGA